MIKTCGTCRHYGPLKKGKKDGCRALQRRFPTAAAACYLYDLNDEQIKKLSRED